MSNQSIFCIQVNVKKDRLKIKVVRYVCTSRLVTKPTKWHERLAKTQINLGIRPVWSESALSAWRKHGSLATHWAPSEDSDQTGRMPRLIWDFARRTVILLVLSRGGSFCGLRPQSSFSYLMVSDRLRKRCGCKRRQDLEYSFLIFRDKMSYHLTILSSLFTCFFDIVVSWMPVRGPSVRQ